MRSMKLTEITYICDIAKALKQKRFCILPNGIAIGLDNIDSYLIYTETDPSILCNPDVYNLVFESRGLSAYCKNIGFETDVSDIFNTSVVQELPQYLSTQYMVLVDRMMVLNNSCPLCERECINNNVESIFKLTKSAGCIYYCHHDRYMLTLFSGMLPLNKNDKIYLTLYPRNECSYIAKFDVFKKQAVLHIYFSYLYI